MGFINKDTLTLDAVLTNKARNYLRKAVFGENKNREHVITKFALSDDEIDYGLWDVTPSGSNFVKHYGQIIDNQPLTEPMVTDNETMRYFLFKHYIDTSGDPEVPLLVSPVSNFSMLLETQLVPPRSNFYMLLV